MAPWADMWADVAEAFPHYSDPAVLAAEDDHNQLALHEQAVRLRARREAETARAAFLAAKWAGLVDRQSKQPLTVQQFLDANYPGVWE